jgi:hypothetical protein
VRRLDDGRAATGDVLARVVVLDVAGDHGVGARTGRRVELIGARAAQHRHPVDPFARIAGRADTPGGRGQDPRGEPGQLGQSHRCGQHANPTEPDLRTARPGHHRHGRDQPEELGKRVVDPVAGDVGVGVRHLQSDPRPDQVVHHPPLVGRPRDGGHPAEEQRMMRDDH